VPWTATDRVGIRRAQSRWARICAAALCDPSMRRSATPGQARPPMCEPARRGTRRSVATATGAAPPRSHRLLGNVTGNDAGMPFAGVSVARQGRENNLSSLRSQRDRGRGHPKRRRRGATGVESPRQASQSAKCGRWCLRRERILQGSGGSRSVSPQPLRGVPVRRRSISFLDSNQRGRCRPCRWQDCPLGQRKLSAIAGLRDALREPRRSRPIGGESHRNTEDFAQFEFPEKLPCSPEASCWKTAPSESE